MGSFPDSAQARIITIGGGKGGVGKSLIACNLAVAFTQLGKRVVLADLDLGAANQHLLLGIARPKEGVQALVDGDVGNVTEALTPTAIPNLMLLAGSGAVLGAANIAYNQKIRLLKKLRALPADIVIIDVGAGVGYNALDFFDLGSQKLVVTTPQVTSIHDAYSFLKSAVLRTLRHHAEKQIEAALLEPAALSTEGEKVKDMLVRLRAQRPEFADKVFEVLRTFNAYMIGNQVQDPAQAGVFRSVAKMVNDYLGIEVPILACVKASGKLHESVNRRKPLMVDGVGEEARLFRQMAETLLSIETAPDYDELDLVIENAPAVSAANQDDTLDPLAPEIAPAPSPQKPPPLPPAAIADAEPTRPKIYQPPPRQKRAPKEKHGEDAPRGKRPGLPGLTPRRHTPYGGMRVRGN